jgi:hypothetical protein
MRNHNKGQAIVLAYLTVVVLTALGGSLLNYSFNTSRHSQIDQLQADAFYLAEGGLEDAASKFSQAIANFQIDPNAALYPASGSIITTFSSGGTASSVITEAELTPRTVVDPDGTAVFVKNYHITTSATHPSNPSVAVTLHQIVARRMIYTFQHAVFYDKDLEWLPGANMTLSGRVHSNSDIYLATESGRTLTVDSTYLKAAGNLYHRRKDNSTVPSGTVQIEKAGSNPVTYPVLTFDSTSPTWTADSQTTWAGTVQTGVHGVTKRSVPVVGSTQPGGFYDTNATLKVTNGVLTEGVMQLIDGSDPACAVVIPACVPSGTITTTTSLYNNRESKFVKMTNIDLNKLGGGTFSGKTYANHLPSNGLVYATRNDAAPTEQPGIRVINGTEIKRAGGLTVVSNDPVYVQGSFNTVAKKPSAVIADAVNILSNNWNDANSTASLNSRVASATTVNAAFIAGINTTTPGSYNGGLENYPRMHEKWTGQTLSITGSFVSLWNSQIATGQWVYGGSQYTAPIRSWNYDSSFASGTSLPPFTPWVVELKKGAWWKD